MPLPSGTNSDYLRVFSELRGGGVWLSTARSWLQSNVKRGDSLSWNSGESVSLSFFKFEDFALKVATAAVSTDRWQRKQDLEALAKKHGVGSVAWLQLQLLDKDPSLPVHFRDPTLVLVSHQVQSVKHQDHVGRESKFPTVLLEAEPLPKQVGLVHEATP